MAVHYVAAVVYRTRVIEIAKPARALKSVKCIRVVMNIRVVRVIKTIKYCSITISLFVFRIESEDCLQFRNP